MLAPILSLAPETPTALIAARLFSFGLLMALALNVWWLARRFADLTGAWLAVSFLLMVPGFLFRAIEIRPDLLAAVLYLLAVNCLLHDKWRWLRSANLLAGGCMAGALLSTQKSFYYVWPMAAMLAWDVIGRLLRRGKLPFFFAHPLWGFSGAVFPHVIFGAWLVFTGAFHDFYEQNVELAIRWQQVPPSFSLSKYLFPIIIQSPVYFVFCLGGLMELIRVIQRGDPAGGEGVFPSMGSEKRCLLIYGVVLLGLLGSLLLNPIPWPYNYIPVLAGMAPLTVFGARMFFRPASPRIRHAIAVLLVAAVLLSFTRSYYGETARSNHIQRESLLTIFRVTRPVDAAFDCNGSYLFRPAAFRYWYHSTAMRTLMNDEFTREIIPSIRKSGAVLWLNDFRAKQLPDNVKLYLTTHYQPYRGAVELWGQYFDLTNGKSSIGEYEAIAPGYYFLRLPPGGLSGVEVQMDGVPIEADQPFFLEAGRHRIQWIVKAGSPECFYILWLPADGKLWTPDFTSHPPFFSCIF